MEESFLTGFLSGGVWGFIIVFVVLFILKGFYVSFIKKKKDL